MEATENVGLCSSVDGSEERNMVMPEGKLKSKVMAHRCKGYKPDNSFMLCSR